jgi:hypothetical protein
MSRAVIRVMLVGAGLAVAACGKGSGGGSPPGDAAADGGGDAPANRFPCLDPRPVAGGGGYVQCQGGWFARPNLAACLTGGANPAPGTGCARDSDCAGGRICACLNGAAPGTCLEATCTSDQDCLPGFRCASGINGRSDSAFWRFDCQRPADACIRDDDCPPVDGGAPRLYACQSPPSGRLCQ